jgi:hypothetical protein
MSKRPQRASASARKNGWRSGLEQRNAAHLDKLGVSYEYEKLKIPYTKPETKHTYTPDFPLTSLGTGKKIIVETKGLFSLDDQKKHLLVKEQHPHLDIRFVFTNPNGRHNKRVKRTYADWCEKHGFLYAKEIIPKEWLLE